MPEVPFDTEVQIDEIEEKKDFKHKPVCVDVSRIYDSCGSKDCLRNLPVYFTAEDQALVGIATAVRVTKASVLTSTVNVDTVAFHRGFYSVDVVFYFAVCCEIYTGTCNLPTTVTGLATYGKRVVLYGSDGNAKTFSSDTAPADIDSSDFDCCPGCPCTMPTANVQISCPMALSAEIDHVCKHTNLPYVPEKVVEFFGSELVAPKNQQILVTLGIFTIVQLTRRVQLLIPSYDFFVPRKECAAKTDDPCEAFSKIEFPADSFFPPSTSENEPDGKPPFDCNCN